MNTFFHKLRCRLFFIALTIAAGLAFRSIAAAQETGAETDTTETETAEAVPAGEATEPQPITDAEAEAAREEGSQAIAAKDYEKAFAAYTKLLRYGSEKPYERPLDVLMGYTGRGQALAGMQEYDTAMEEFKFATDQSQNFTPALIARGQMFLEMGAVADALSDFQAALKYDRGNVQAQFGLGKSYAMAGYSEQSIKPLSRVIAAEPQNAEAYRLRGTGYAGVLKVQEALADLQEAIALNPQDYEAYYTLALVYLREEQFDKAAEEVRRAIQNYTPKPGQEGIPYMNGYLTLATTYIEYGKKTTDPDAKKAAFQAAIDQSETLLNQMDKRNPGYAPYRAAALHSRGVGERMQGELGKAIRTFTEAIELNPNLAEAYFRRGICFNLIGEDKMAIADFVQSANLNIEQPDPRANLWEGFTHAKSGDYLEAVRAYGNAIAASDRYTPAFVNRGLAYMQLEEFDKAIADFNEAIRLEPAQAEHYYKRGVAYARQADYEKASASFATAIALNDKHVDAYRQMASMMQQLGRTELASEYRQKANQLSPERSSP
jgi:tetratricopeptide (TPR) repeat protein